MKKIMKKKKKEAQTEPKSPNQFTQAKLIQSETRTVSMIV